MLWGLWNGFYARGNRMTYDERVAYIESLPHGPIRFLAAWKFRQEIHQLSSNGKLYMNDKKPAPRTESNQ